MSLEQTFTMHNTFSSSLVSVNKQKMTKVFQIILRILNSYILDFFLWTTFVCFEYFFARPTIDVLWRCLPLGNWRRPGFKPSSTGGRTVQGINIRHLESSSLERWTMPQIGIQQLSQLQDPRNGQVGKSG